MQTITEQSTLTKSQYTSKGPRAISGYGPGAALWVHLRFDYGCGNGHNSFAITGSVKVPKVAACGCLHEDIARVYPELEKYIKWHLCSTDGPMHYIANTVFFASGDGKKRELDAARNAAIWPDATDEDLTAPGLEDRLKARLPKLLADFRAAMEELGFVW